MIMTKVIMAVVIVMVVTSCDAVVEHGEDKEGGVEAGENHQQVVERVPHAEKGHWLDIFDNHPYPFLHQFPFDHGKAPSTGFLRAVLIIIILSIALGNSSTFYKTSITKCPVNNLIKSQ